MKKPKISVRSAVVITALSVWIITSLFYPLYRNPNDIIVTLYFGVSILSLFLAIMDEKKMMMYSLLMMALTPSVEVIWTLCRGLSIHEILGRDEVRVQLGLNIVGLQGFILLSTIGPLVIFYLGHIIHKSNIKSAKDLT
jgi:hypothetical protein